MGQIEQLNKLVGWGVGRICINCEHTQTPHNRFVKGLPLVTVGIGRLGWACQKCGYLHEEPKNK